jgi:hypothetical protein
VQPVPPLEELPDSPDGAADTRGRLRRRRRGMIPIVLLSVALTAAVAALGFHLIKLDDANNRIEQQERQLEDQRNLIEKKETFGAAMKGLIATASEFDGVLMTSLVPLDQYQVIASRAWSHRTNPSALDRDIGAARTASRDLQDVLTGANAQAKTNITGTTYEAVIDRLGGGFVATVIDDADSLCNADVLACVSTDDPLTVHFDPTDSSLPYMTDWLRTGVAYHEFAHVLQITNPELTRTALERFGDDDEAMADCFALTYLDGWTLDHRIWLSDDYWDVNIGYGHTCDEAQRQAVREWYDQLGFQPRPISQRS